MHPNTRMMLPVGTRGMTAGRVSDPEDEEELGTAPTTQIRSVDMLPAIPRKPAYFEEAYHALEGTMRRDFELNG